MEMLLSAERSHEANLPLITLVAGARPNFMKIAPIARALDATEAVRYEIVHTGQHYDSSMSDVFFEQLRIPQPSHHLEARSGTHAEQTARVMVGFEKYCDRARPDLVIVVGDVNSTLACSIVAKKMSIPVGHVEAGLRSGDMTMPEEVNRIVTDAISDYFFVTEPSGVENLLKEGKPQDTIHFVGHVMIDNLYFQLKSIASHPSDDNPASRLKKQLGRYAVMTLHRPSNVDDPATLVRLINAFNRVAENIPIIFPAHPRTRQNIDKLGVHLDSSLYMLEPLAFNEFLSVWKDAVFVVTDSGGLQEETTALGVPCITVRENTERPVTVTNGTNRLVGTETEKIIEACEAALVGDKTNYEPPELWDGKAAERIVEILSKIIKFELR